MAKSLQDQLLGLGVVDKKKANKAKKVQKQQQKAKQKQGIDANAQQREVLEKQRQEKIEADRALNAEKNKLAEQKAITAQINQIIEMNAIECDGDIEYQYVQDTKIKKLYVNEEIQLQLANGRVVLVAYQDGAKVIGFGAGEKVKQRDESLILVCNEKQEIDEDDPYADFQIPDDLMW